MGADVSNNANISTTPGKPSNHKKSTTPVQCRTNVKCYTNVLCSLGTSRSASRKARVCEQNQHSHLPSGNKASKQSRSNAGPPSTTPDQRQSSKRRPPKAVLNWAIIVYNMKSHYSCLPGNMLGNLSRPITNIAVFNITFIFIMFICIFYIYCEFV